MTPMEDLIQRFDIDVDECPQAQAVIDQIAELVLALKLASILNNKNDHWNPYSPFAVKISELTGLPVGCVSIEEEK